MIRDTKESSRWAAEEGQYVTSHACSAMGRALAGVHWMCCALLLPLYGSPADVRRVSRLSVYGVMWRAV
jgi:hypothetical protein